MYSKALPWKLLLPLFVITLTVAPELRPCSAPNRLVWILNSRMSSTLGRTVIKAFLRKLSSTAVEREIVRHLAITIHHQLGAGASVVGARTTADGARRAITDADRARAQDRELCEITAIQRQIADRLGLDHLAD